MGQRPSSDLINWRSLQQLSDGDQGFERQLLTIFVEDTQRHLERLVDAIADQDADRVRSVAHYLKGSSGNVGIMALHQCAATLESLARQGNLSASDALLGEMQGLFQQVQGVLYRWH